jgi:hypothetical protein
MSPEKKVNLAQLGFGTQIPSAEPDWFAAQNHEAKTIPASGSKRIHWRCNLSGLLSNHRWIPLWALGGSVGLQVSFFLAPVNDSLIKSHGGVTYSQSYLLKDCRALSSVVTLDSDLQESFNAALLGGTALRYQTKTIEPVWSYLANSSVSGNFDVAKLCNTFYVHPGSEETLQYSLQLGTKRIPDNDSIGFSEAWWRLLNCVGISGSLAHSTGITYADYASSSFCIGISCEKLPHLASTGENLSNTSTIFLRIKGWVTTAADLPSRCLLIPEYDQILEIRDTTVELFS